MHLPNGNGEVLRGKTIVAVWTRRRFSRRLVGNGPEEESDAFMQIALLAHERDVVRTPRIENAGYRECAETANYRWHGM